MGRYKCHSKSRSRSRSRSPHSDRRSVSSDEEQSRSKRRTKRRKFDVWRDREGYKRKPLRRKMSLYWDVPAHGFEHVPPTKYKEMLKNGEVIAAISPCARQALVPVLSATVTRQARRLYIGNIPFGVTDDDMMGFFNNQMHIDGLSQADGNPVLACQINLEKNFAFIEFRSIDETTQAMSLDGVAFKGQNLKIRRPHDYHPLPGETEPQTVRPVIRGVISNVVPDSPNKIFIGGLPNFLIEDQIKDLLQSFGELRALNLIKDTNTGLNKGYAFCEYVDPSLTDLAIVSLNGMAIGERKISVQRAILGTKSAAANATANGTASAVFKPLVGHMKCDAATEVLCLLNVVTMDELKDDDEYDEIVNDIKDECEKYGVVRSIEVPRPIEGLQVAGSGKVYIEFNSVFDCEKAQQALSGRKFSGRTVVTSYYDLQKYNRREFN